MYVTLLHCLSAVLCIVKVYDTLVMKEVAKGSRQKRQTISLSVPGAEIH